MNREKKLKSNGYEHFMSFDKDGDKAKSFAKNLRATGMSATVFSYSRHGIKYYAVYAKEREAKA